MNNLKKELDNTGGWATALQGFGAGVAGRGAEFLQGLDDARSNALVKDAYTTQQHLLNGNVPDALALLNNRVELLGGRDASDTQGIIDLIGSGNIQGAIGQLQIPIDYAIGLGKFKPPGSSGGLASAKTEIFGNGAVVFALPSGETVVQDPSGNIVTGEDRDRVLKEARNFDLQFKQQEADIAVRQAQDTAAAKQRAIRESDLTRAMSERNRTSKRMTARLRQAFILANKATQGVTGTLKTRMAKLFPDIDVADEASLNQSLKLLALEQLQKFKGPTTDFEFQQVEDIAGRFSDPKTANIAKIKAMQRAEWFNQREFEQWKKWKAAGKDPDTFGFDYGERIKTKRGEFTLQDIQDTAVKNNLTIEEALNLPPGIIPQPLPSGVTEDDIRVTMRNHNMTREQVLSMLGGR